MPPEKKLTVLASLFSPSKVFLRDLPLRLHVILHLRVSLCSHAWYRKQAQISLYMLAFTMILLTWEK